jgi:transcriptional regulator with XRE-family HTH domain
MWIIGQMKDQQLGRLFRLLRVRKGWRQEDAAGRARVSRKVVQKIEHGDVGHTSLDLVRRYGNAFDLRVDLLVGGRGGDLARTVDEEHALIVERIAGLVTDSGWVVEPEASFNHYGDRGRVDLLAYHAAIGTLLIVEVKTVFTDLQEMFGSMNIKLRVAPHIARDRGWQVRQTGSLLAVASSAVSLKIVRRHATLFAPFASTTAQVRQWIRRPVADARMLLWVSPPPNKRAWNAGRQRVRLSPEARSGTKRPAVAPAARSPTRPVAPPKGSVNSAAPAEVAHNGSDGTR